MPQSSSNLIMGTVKGYNFKQVEPFFSTLQKTGFQGDVVCFISRLRSKTIKRIKGYGVRLVPFGKVNVPPKYNRYMDICSKRFIFYYLFLEANPKKYKNVMLTDVRDVIFQKNPFDFKFRDNVCVFQESQSIAFGKKTNALWVKKLFGDNILQEIKDKPVVCAGTIIGSYDKILNYLRKMVWYISRTPAERGDDQAVHNFLVYENKIKGQKIFSNEEGPVLTLGAATADFDITKQDLVKNKSGRIVNIVHQFDRIPYLRKKYLSFFTRVRLIIRSALVRFLKYALPLRTFRALKRFKNQ